MKEISLKTISKQQKEYTKFKYNRYNKKAIVLETVTGWSFLSPLLLVVLVFSTLAIVLALILSMYKGSASSLEWVGFDNWTKMFKFADIIGLNTAFKNTFKFAAITVPIQIGIALLLSALLNSGVVKKGTKNFFLIFFFLPLITSGVASTTIFSRLVSQEGFIKINPFKDPGSLLYVAIAATVWQTVASSLILMNTAFTSIDKTQYEAAAIDGASSIKKLTKITIPSIFPIVAYTIFTGVISALAVFDGPFMLASTAGIPDFSSFTTLILAGYQFIQPVGAMSSGIQTNIGLGTSILFLTAFVMGVSTTAVNVLFPIGKAA